MSHAQMSSNIIHMFMYSHLRFKRLVRKFQKASVYRNKVVKIKEEMQKQLLLN